MSKLLLGGDIPYNIINTSVQDRIYVGEKWGVDWYVYPPIKKIVCGGKEVYFNPFTYNASIRNNIVLPGVNYYYEFTPSPSVLGFRISPSATFTNNIYNYSKPMKAFFTQTGTYLKDYTYYYPNISGVAQASCTLLRVYRGGYYISLFTSKNSSNLSYASDLYLRVFNANNSTNYDLFKFYLPYGTNKAFNRVSAAMSLLAPTGNTNDGIFLDLMCNCQVNTVNVDNNNTNVFFSTRFKINSSGKLSNIYFNRDTNEDISTSYYVQNDSGTERGIIIRNLMNSTSDFLSDSSGWTSSTYNAIWS